MGFLACGLLAGDEVRWGAFDGACELVELRELLELLVCLGDDPFPHVGVRDGVFGAEGIHHLSTADAEAGFERVGAVVEAGVDDLFRVSRYFFLVGSLREY